MKRITLFCLSLFLFFSCDVAQQVAGTLSLAQCKYDFNSISNLSLAGVNLQNANNRSSSNLLSSAGVISAFLSSSGSLPLNFTLNLDVKNPNAQTAILNGLNYILEIDGLEMTTGSLNESLQIAANQTTKLPVAMSFDLMKVMKGQSLESIKNLAFNFAGIGDKSSNVTVKLQPSIKIGTQTIKSPTYIPVSFTLNK